MKKFVASRKGSLQCEGCSNKLAMFWEKKSCFSCKNNFCRVCIMRRPDKKMCCKKCQILTATPLDKNDLLNLRSRDLVNYLSSRHISTSGCVEKEDLVNVLMSAVNGGNSPAHSVGNSGNNSYSNSPSRNSVSSIQSDLDREARQSSEHLYNEDGIRIIGINAPENEGSCSSSNHSSNSEILNEADWVVINDRVQTSENLDQNGDQSHGVEPTSSTQQEMQCSISNDANSTDAKKEKSHRILKLSDITCSADLDNLSVKELKTLLMTNRTDFKGCVERAELIEKASRLWSDYTLSRRDLEKLSLEELCKICMDAPIECVLLECGHMATCMSCGKQLSECPVCRQYVVRCVRTFKV